MDLICTEVVNFSDNSNCSFTSTDNSFVHKAIEDPAFLQDRCLENLLKREDKQSSGCSYFNTIQKDITPKMRKIVAEWVLEICDEQKCQEEVSILTLNYMDQFLSLKPIKKTHLQLLAATCLLLASKLREPSCRALPVKLLVFYTDNSITKKDLIQMELLVLSLLKWDLSTVTPLDFLHLLLSKLPIKSTRCPDIEIEKVRKHAQAFVSLAAKEHYFSIYSASTIAAGSIAASLVGLNWHARTNTKIQKLLDMLTDLTGVEQEYIHECMMKMENVFEEQRNQLPLYISGTIDVENNKINKSQKPQYNSVLSEKIRNSVTPTDVQDVEF
uniref:CSON011294 protein n=1 Tax=Culicoides sonorensis TaxID=179676 RepID=A0A336K757_CULSO